MDERSEHDLPSSDSTQEEAFSAAQISRAKRRRQDELLDQGLLETFPASDPVSVARIK